MAQIIDPASVQGGSGASDAGGGSGLLPNGQRAAMTEGLSVIHRDDIERETAEKAQQMGISYIDIARTPVNPDLLRLVNGDRSRATKAIPFLLAGNVLRIAAVDPQSAEFIALVGDLKAQRFEVDVNLCSQQSFDEALHVYDFEKSFKKQELVTVVEQNRITAYEKEIALLSDMREKVEKLTAEEALNFIEVGAIKTNASDIHYEPGEQLTRVRFRIDGVLHKIFDLDTTIYKNIANQLKYRAKMKLNVTTIPQDGRYNFRINERQIDVRVSAIPTEYGESFVCRLLDNGRSVLTFEQMGFVDRSLETMNHLATLSHGMVLVTGPTGSGKTTTLYALLHQFNQVDTKVITLEDPVEYKLPGITQSQIDEAHGYSFADGLRTILRQDPDVVMIGEIRDLDTANVAAQAALTGHVLLSTLHTNSAIESIPRLVNMGLQEFIIAPSLHTIIAQRLVRRVCRCAQAVGAGDGAYVSVREKLAKMIEVLKGVRPDLAIAMPETIMKPVGCDVCSKTGYKGQLVIAEMVTIDSDLQELILQKASVAKLLEMARKKGMMTMEEDGLLKVIKGLTTVEEVFRATNMNT